MVPKRFLNLKEEKKEKKKKYVVSGQDGMDSQSESTCWIVSGV
jgi:hypothetical protein